jgi:hypothetical protein
MAKVFFENGAPVPLDTPYFLNDLAIHPVNHSVNDLRNDLQRAINEVSSLGQFPIVTDIIVPPDLGGAWNAIISAADGNLYKIGFVIGPDNEPELTDIPPKKVEADIVYQEEGAPEVDPLGQLANDGAAGGGAGGAGAPGGPGAAGPAATAPGGGAGNSFMADGQYVQGVVAKKKRQRTVDGLIPSPA